MHINYKKRTSIWHFFECEWLTSAFYFLKYSLQNAMTNTITFEEMSDNNSISAGSINTSLHSRICVHCLCQMQLCLLSFGFYKWPSCKNLVIEFGFFIYWIINDEEINQLLQHLGILSLYPLSYSLSAYWV